MNYSEWNDGIIVYLKKVLVKKNGNSLELLYY